MENLIEKILSPLTDDEKTLLKDTILHGSWGSAEYDFAEEDGSISTKPMYGYCTNDAVLGGHFSGRIVSQMFRSIYKKMCGYYKNQIGNVISHCHDWWEDGSGDMLFIREEYVDMFEEWAAKGGEK